MEKITSQLSAPAQLASTDIKPSHPGPAERVLVLAPGRAERNYWSDLWFYRELFAKLAWRDLAVRYKQTAIGIAWAIIRPLLSGLILTIVFGRLAKLPSVGSAPYAVMVYAGTLPWFLLSTILSDASNSLVGNANVISKVYFPRIIVPAATMLVALADFVVSFAVLLAIMAWYRFWPDWRIVFLPFFIVIALVTAFGPALLMAAMNVKYRDFRFIIPFALQFGLFISPVGFSSAIVPEKWRLIYSLNPAVGVIDGFRWCLLGGVAQLDLPGFLLSLLIVALFLILGVRYFRQTERTFADHL